jgi:hypothetical protein
LQKRRISDEQGRVFHTFKPVVSSVIKPRVRPAKRADKQRRIITKKIMSPRGSKGASVSDNCSVTLGAVP